MTLRERSYLTPSQVKKAAKSQNFVGPNGNEAIGYGWQWKWDVRYDDDGNGVADAKTSDWSKASVCAACNKKIVHVYWVKDTSGNIAPYGGDHLHLALGYPGELSQDKLTSIQNIITPVDSGKDAKS